MNEGAVNYPLDIQDDEVALEDNEVFTLRLGSPSDGRVRIGGTAGGVQYFASTRITIVDDDCELQYAIISHFIIIPYFLV